MHPEMEIQSLCAHSHADGRKQLNKTFLELHSKTAMLSLTTEETGDFFEFFFFFFFFWWKKKPWHPKLIWKDLIYTLDAWLNSCNAIPFSLAATLKVLA